MWYGGVEVGWRCGGVMGVVWWGGGGWCDVMGVVGVWWGGGVL